jgi:hypothetical protein
MPCGDEGRGLLSSHPAISANPQAAACLIGDEANQAMRPIMSPVVKPFSSNEVANQ